MGEERPAKVPKVDAGAAPTRTKRSISDSLRSAITTSSRDFLHDLSGGIPVARVREVRASFSLMRDVAASGGRQSPGFEYVASLGFCYEPEFELSTDSGFRAYRGDFDKTVLYSSSRFVSGSRVIAFPFLHL